MKTNTFIVYMPKIAAALRKRGFRILEVIPNDKKPQFDAYVFEDCPEFRKVFSEIVNNK